MPIKVAECIEYRASVYVRTTHFKFDIYSG
jgi:hypothetical protein